MRVRMLTTMAGPEGAWPAGAVASLPDETAMSLVVAGYAVAVDPVIVAPAPAPETASVQPGAETAVLPKARRRRGA
jgi:hypothetical protein